EASNLKRNLRCVASPLHAQNDRSHLGPALVVKVLKQLADLALRVIAQRLRYLDVLSGNRDLDRARLLHGLRLLNLRVPLPVPILMYCFPRADTGSCRAGGNTGFLREGGLPATSGPRRA